MRTIVKNNQVETVQMQDVPQDNAVFVKRHNELFGMLRRGVSGKWYLCFAADDQGVPYPTREALMEKLLKDGYELLTP